MKFAPEPNRRTCPCVCTDMSVPKPVVMVVDYGTGNILSVTRALEHVGADAVVTSDPLRIEQADKLLLPGVGAFGRAMENLNRRNLVEPIRAFAASGRPFLGICLGMQLMLDRSEEFGGHEGLGLIAGEVVPIPRTTAGGAAHKIPHIGWNALLPPRPGRWENTVMDGIEAGTGMYFVHSLSANPQNDADRLADTDYNGQLISAAIQRGNLTGLQCHPEKSASAGLCVLKNFVDP